jgi:hypothetical protein
MICNAAVGWQNGFKASSGSFVPFYAPHQCTYIACGCSYCRKPQFPSIIGKNHVDGSKARSKQMRPRQGMISQSGDVNVIFGFTQRYYIAKSKRVGRSVGKRNCGLIIPFYRIKFGVSRQLVYFLKQNLISRFLAEKRYSLCSSVFAIEHVRK